MAADNTVIVYAKRTPIGKMSGSLSTIPAPQLGAALVKDAIAKTGLDAAKVDEILMGQVLTAGVGQAPARQTALFGGLPDSVSATTLNRVCGSGMRAVILGHQAIQTGDAQIVLAGGQENMSLAPHLLPGSRAGYRFGSFEAKDHMQYDGLFDPYDQVPMGVCGEECAREFHFTREEQDRFALTSYTRARQASENGTFRREIVPVEVLIRGQGELISSDEEPFAVDLERLPKLRAAFTKDGTLTAGNSSSINDGAALLMLMSEKKAQAEGLTPLARILGHSAHAQKPSQFTTAPIHCIEKVLNKTGLKTQDIDLWEINEAFAVVTMATSQKLGLNAEKVNVHGGAVALGHPIGASGARILVTLLSAMQARKARRGVAAICIGGGEANAMVIEAI